jgi:hypothetical protein
VVETVNQCRREREAAAATALPELVERLARQRLTAFTEQPPVGR